MRICNRTVILAIPVALAGVSAQAGGYITPAAAVPFVTPASWEGAYVGASLGYAFGGDDVVGLYRDGDWLRDVTNYEMSGLALGLNVGYRWENGNWVFGPELGVVGGDVKDSVSAGASNGGYSGESKLKQAVNLRFKAGYIGSADRNTLIYGMVGVSKASFDYSVTGVGDFGEVSIDDEINPTGYIFGFGIERRLNESLSVLTEFEYANYGKTHLVDVGGTSTEATPKFNTVRIGLNYRF